MDLLQEGGQLGVANVLQAEMGIDTIEFPGLASQRLVLEVLDPVYLALDGTDVHADIGGWIGMLATAQFEDALVGRLVDLDHIVPGDIETKNSKEFRRTQ